MHYFSSKSSKTSHLNHKTSDKRATFCDKWSPGGGGGRSAPQPPWASALGCAALTFIGVPDVQGIGNTFSRAGHKLGILTQVVGKLL